VSNPDLAGPYWQDEGEAGYGSGWRASRDVPSRQQPAWDDGGGFWRDDSSRSSAGPDRGPSRHQAAPYRDRQTPPRGSRREAQSADDWGSRRDAGRSAGRGHRSADDDRADWTGRLSQTAGDLRSKLGSMRTRAAASLGGDRRQAAWGGAGEDDFWAEQGGRRAGSPARGSQSQREAGPGRGARRAAHAGGYGADRYEVGGYGPGDYGPGGDDSRTAAGRTALRDPAGDFWDQPDRTSRGVRSRVAERQYTHGGGNGRGGGGHGGGRSNGGGPRSHGGGFKNWLLYGRWWRHWTLKKALAVVGVGIAACFLLGIVGFFMLYEMTPIPTASELTANWQSSTVYLANGKQMGTYDTSVDGVSIDRLLLTPAQIPSLMTHAMTAAEDRHFYTEGGVSITGLMRAAYEDVRGNGNLQGGSTITMQYAKNYYAGVNTGQNLSTKLKEIFIAMKLGRAKSKSWVMTNYLNTVPFGSTIDGLGAAAESYFNVNLSQPGAKLSVAQAALLAAMPNNPAVFSGVVLSPKPQSAPGYSELQSRFEYVLTNMVRDGNITQAQANAATFPKITPPPGGNGETGVTGYLMNMVEQQLEAPVADGGYNLTQQLDTGGYKIRTTFNMAKINALARAVRTEKAEMKVAAEDSGGVYVSFRSYDRIGAVLENSKTGAIVAIYGGPGYLSNQKSCNASNCQINMAESAEQVGSSFKPYVLSAAVKQGMSVFTSKLNGYSPIWIPLTSVNGQSAQLALSPTSPPPGCPRPTPGQTGDCNSTNGTRYFLFNEASENYGVLKPNVAAAVSSDSAFEDLAHRDGIQSVINMAQQFGVGQNAFVEPCGASSGGSGTVAATIAACNDLTGPGYKIGGQWYPGHGLENNFSPTKFDKGGEAAGTPGSPAIALGENPLTPIEQASTFATLADDGVYHTPHVIQSLQKNGTTLPSHVITRTVLSPGAAADVDWALSFDNNLDEGNGLVGTADGSIPFRRGDVIGKTGTLGSGANASQAWFIGATPDQFALSVALFTNDPGKQNLDNLPYANGTPGSQGGGWPASVWNAYMENQEINAPTIPLFTQVQAGFVPWIQVVAKAKPKKQFCKPGGGFGHGGGNQQGCVCPQGAAFCGHNPNPQPSCNGNCTTGAPSPSPSCQVSAFGQCSSPSPSVTPSVTPSTSCSTGQPGQCQAANLTAYIRSSPGSSSSAASIVVLAAEDAAKLTALLGPVI